MTPAAEALPQTLVGYVPPWEIDANGHWNTQFYLDAFRAAAERAVGYPARRAVLVDHLRFFRELHALETLSVASARVPDAAEGYGLVQLMRHGGTDVLCACAYSNLPAKAVEELPLLPAALYQRTAPRGLTPGAHPAQDTEALLRNGRAAVTHVGVLHPGDLGEDGAVTARAMQSRVSDGTGHLWAFLGIRQSDFYENGLGRAIVELKITRRGTAEAGQPVRLVSWLQTLGARGFYLRHRLEDLTTGAMLADHETLTLILDLKARRSAPVPEAMGRILAPRTAAPAG